MTIGISKERLEEILQSNQCTFEREILDEIIKECTELNPWLPIESAPLYRKLRLVHGGQLGTGQADAILYQESDKQYFTHWQELPGDPK